MTTDAALLAEIGRALQDAERIVLTSHIRPDGDAVGSLLGLGLALQQAGKQVQMVLADGLPASFRHLPGAKQVRRQPEGQADLLVVLDASDLQRIGPALDGYGQPDVCIDHHKTNLYYARYNLVEPDVQATAAIIARYLPAWGLDITPEVASALLTGILTDTIGFRTPNVDAELLRLAADLVTRGAPLADLYYRALVVRRFEAMRYWGQGLSRLTRDGDLVWTALTLEDRQLAGYNGNDDADLVNILSAIEGFRVALIFVEQPGNRYKMSWRSNAPDVDVSGVARYFGGGGHAAAAGAERAGNLQEDLPMIVAKTKTMLGIQ